MTQKQKIIELMADQEWHSSAELHDKICWRYSARLYDLRRDGYLFEKKNDPDHQKLEFWRLVSAPARTFLQSRPADPQEVMF